MKGMTNVIITDLKNAPDFLPLNFLKSIASLRVGILTIEDKWKYYNLGTISHHTAPYLSHKYKCSIGTDNLIINACLLPRDPIVDYIKTLPTGTICLYKDQIIAARLSKADATQFLIDCDHHQLKSEIIHLPSELTPTILDKHIDILSYNSKEVEIDYHRLTNGRKSQPISASNTILGKGQIFLEHGVSMEACTINTNDSYIYLGKNVIIMEGSLIRGNFAACENSHVKMGAKIYGTTVIGPNCRIGGEVKDVVIQQNSNKGHDGFLGDSLIGEWCNLGADTNTSNLKNNYLDVKLYSYRTQKFEDTKRQFCGLIMGDHSKCGINTMFNTGTVTGIACNIFGSGYPRNFIPSFSWGGAAGFVEHKLDKVLETAEIVMQRRGEFLTVEDKKLLMHLFENK